MATGTAGRELTAEQERQFLGAAVSAGRGLAQGWRLFPPLPGQPGVGGGAAVDVGAAPERAGTRGYPGRPAAAGSRRGVRAASRAPADTSRKAATHTSATAAPEATLR